MGPVEHNTRCYTEHNVDAQADDVVVWAFGAVPALQLTKPLHPFTPESFEPAALQVS